MSTYEPGTVAVATVRGVPRAFYYRPEFELPWVIATTAGRMDSPSNYHASDLPDFQVVAVPKPAEPMGDGAVVEDINGHRWVRIAGPEPERESKPWRHRGHTARTWDHINPAHILSEGVKP